jgi:hypothetical protein
MVDFLAIAYVDEGVFGSSLVFASRAMRDDKESGKAPSQCYTMGKYKERDKSYLMCISTEDHQYHAQSPS